MVSPTRSFWGANRNFSQRFITQSLSYTLPTSELLIPQPHCLLQAAMDSFGCSEGANASLEALQDALQRSHSQPASNSPLLMPPPALPFALSVGAAPLSAQAPQPLPNACLLNNAQSQPALQPDEDYDSWFTRISATWLKFQTSKQF